MAGSGAGWAGRATGSRTGPIGPRPTPIRFPASASIAPIATASAANNQTFSVLKNIAGEPGDPLVYLTQRFFLDSLWQGQHNRIAQSALSSTPYRDGKLQLRLCAHLWEQARTDEPAFGRAHAVRDLRQCLGQGRTADRREPVPDVGPVPRLPQRRRHRAAVRHDPAGPRRQAHQQFAVRHVERLADGTGGPRSVLFRPARERDRNVPSNGICEDRRYLPRLSRRPRSASSRDRSPDERQRLRDVLALDRRCRTLSAGRSRQQARQLRGAGAGRRVVHRMSPHGARQGRGGQARQRAAERLRAGAPGSAQSRPDRIRQVVHRQLSGRPARPALRPVPRPEENSDASRHRQRSRAFDTHP